MLKGFLKRFLNTELLAKTESSVFVEEDDETMWLIVGLGNHGDKYAKNRHNIGFMVVDAMMDGAISFPPLKSKFLSEYSEAQVNGQKIVLLKPQTYMNESGQAVGKTAQFYKIPAERIIVIHDELDLKPGEVRLKKGGGAAGHNGLKSVTAHLGTPDFWRFRIGIGHPGDKNRVSDYVLSDFSKSEHIIIEACEEAFAEYTDKLVKEGVEAYAKMVINHISEYLKNKG